MRSPYYFVAVNQDIIKLVNENYMIWLDVADIRLWLCDFLIAFLPSRFSPEHCVNKVSYIYSSWVVRRFYFK